MFPQALWACSRCRWSSSPAELAAVAPADQRLGRAQVVVGSVAADGHQRHAQTGQRLGIGDQALVVATLDSDAVGSSDVEIQSRSRPFEKNLPSPTATIVTVAVAV